MGLGFREMNCSYIHSRVRLVVLPLFIPSFVHLYVRSCFAGASVVASDKTNVIKSDGLFLASFTSVNEFNLIMYLDCADE